MFFIKNQLLTSRWFSVKSSEHIKSYLIENIEKFPLRALDYSRFHDQLDLYVTVPQTTLEISRIHLLHGLVPYKIVTELSRHFIPKSIRFEVKSLTITDEKQAATFQSLKAKSSYTEKAKSSYTEKVKFLGNDPFLEYQFRVQIHSELKRTEKTNYLPITLHLPEFHLIQSSFENPEKPRLLSSSPLIDLENKSSPDVLAEAIFVYQVEKDSLLIKKHHIVLTYPTFSTLSLSSA